MTFNSPPYGKLHPLTTVDNSQDRVTTAHDDSLQSDEEDMDDYYCSTSSKTTEEVKTFLNIAFNKTTGDGGVTRSDLYESSITRHRA